MFFKFFIFFKFFFNIFKPYHIIYEVYLAQYQRDFILYTLFLKLFVMAGNFLFCFGFLPVPFFLGVNFF